MDLTVNVKDVEEVIESEVKASKLSTSGYIYVPLKYKGRKVKVCILKECK